MSRSHRPPRRPAKRTAIPLPVVELTIDRMSHDGRGIALWQNKTVFVASALVGEKVRARLIKHTARYAEAVIETLLLPGAERQPPRCQYFGECGGCQLQHMPEANQRVMKQAAVLDQVARFGGQTPVRVLPPITSEPQGYRSRARLGVWFSQTGKLSFGFRRFAGRELVDIDHCPVLVPALQALIAPLKTLLSVHATRFVTHIELTEAGGRVCAVVRHTQSLPETLLSAFATFAASTGCALWLQPDKNPQALTTLAGEIVDPRLSYRLPAFDCTLYLHPADFIQVNARVNEAMVAQALALLAPTVDEHVLDLFCGMGNFTLPLARQAGRVTGVEAIETMVGRGRENARANAMGNVQFVAADLSRTRAAELLQKIGPIDALLLDPPRDGAREVCEQIKELNPARLVYVSCNPATLARDSASLAAAGYRLEALGILDMFPETAHVESMALFIRH